MNRRAEGGGRRKERRGRAWLARKRGRSRAAILETGGSSTVAAALLASASPAADTSPMPAPLRASLRDRVWMALAVIGLLSLHYALAAQSLLEENPTIDEVVHLPAGVTYWQKHTFRLYHHNPPLVKLVAALPVVWSGAVTRHSTK